MAQRALRIAYYGDDFTGATDTLATATQGGLRTLLFLRVPTPDMLAAAGDLDCLGIAGASRSMAPAGHGAASFARWRRSSRDSMRRSSTTRPARPSTARRDVGNIAVAARVLSASDSRPVLPIVGGQPNIGRYCVFGHLFAVRRGRWAGVAHRPASDVASSGDADDRVRSAAASRAAGTGEYQVGVPIPLMTRRRTCSIVPSSRLPGRAVRCCST